MIGLCRYFPLDLPGTLEIAITTEATRFVSLVRAYLARALLLSGDRAAAQECRQLEEVLG